jgi:hypothetical protein
MSEKNILTVGVAAVLQVAIANNVGYQTHCEVHGGQCLHNAPDQHHVEPGDIGTVSLLVPTSINATITPDPGALGSNGTGPMLAPPSAGVLTATFTEQLPPGAQIIDSAPAPTYFPTVGVQVNPA